MSWRLTRPVVAALSFFYAATWLARCASASTTVVPPVTITQLSHSVSSGLAYDAVPFPDGSVESDGFSAAIATGDTISIRFQAPAGKKFVIHGGHGQPGNPEMLFVNAYWTAGFDLALYSSPYILSFVNLNGLAPIVQPVGCYVSNHGLELGVAFNFLVDGDLQFTALDIQIIAAPPFAPASQHYSGVQSRVTPSWGTQAPTPDATLMEIVPIGSVPAAATSWGRVKLRYR